MVDSAPPRLLALHDAIKPQAERYARLYVTALTDELGLSVAEHSVIIRAIDAGDADTAQRAIQTNWRNAAQRVGRADLRVGRKRWLVVRSGCPGPKTFPEILFIDSFHPRRNP